MMIRKCKYRVTMPLILMGAMLIQGCTFVGQAESEKTQQAAANNKTPVIAQVEGKSQSATSEEPAQGCLDKRMEAAAARAAKSPTAQEMESFKKSGVNESGEVMIIMYHRIAAKNSTYDRTAEDFVKDLERLHAMGFQPVSMWDYINGRFDVPMGKTPYVLTFDDGSISNFKVIGLDASGNPIIDPNCAVGLMSAFEKKHSDVKMKATFFLNGGVPFEQKEYGDLKIKWLLENGYEIGNHSYGHENFKKLDDNQVQESLGKNNAKLLDRVAKANVPESLNAMHGIYALALPFGSRPDEAYRHVLVKGSYDGKTYEHGAILNVGWKPGSSPYLQKNDPTSLHRVQCGDGEMQLTYWLDDYEKKPQKRFISDGYPESIVVPADMKKELKPEWEERCHTY